MKLKLAKMIKAMTFEEMHDFSLELFHDYEGIVADGQGFDPYVIAQGLIGTANAVILKHDDEEVKK